MVNTSKILTVSYGTFSCTLEGFDDSFDTMKAIAEYFRDLAAEDRYFGAEPPVPDAEMLARIAEREIARRVEAREERGSIVLRAAPYGAVSAPLPAFAAAPFAAAPFAATAQTTAPAVPAATQPATPEADAPVADAPTAQAAATARPVETVQPAQTAQPVADAAISQPQAPVKPPVARIEPVAPTEPVADMWEDVAHDAPLRPAAMPSGMPTPVPHPDPDSVAAKLQRIRDVVTKSAAVAVPHSYSEDEHADNFLSDTVESMETALDLDDQVADDHSEDDGDEIAALLSRLAQDAPDQAEAASAVADHDVALDDEQDAATEQELPVADDLADAMLTAQQPEVAAESEHDAAAMAQDGDDLAAEDDTVSETSEESDAPSDAGRVLTVKRAEFDAAIAKGDLIVEDDDSDTAPDAADAAQADADTAYEDDETDQPLRYEMPKLTPNQDLSPEDEDALRQELAAVEAELVEITRTADEVIAPQLETAAFDDEDEDDDNDDLTSLFSDDEDEDDEDDISDQADTDQHAQDDDAPHVLRDPRERLVGSTAEDDMSRLMAKAETALTEPESASRRNAIAHLRAAVAATKAEQSAGTHVARTPTSTAFRDDLANVVRPRRPVGEGAAPTPRPSEPRPAPLKLVAEQRIDLPDGHVSTPVRPRRVSLAQATDEAQDMPAQPADPVEAEGGFALFASKMGATELSDVLEAAAAYLTHVEGRETFSRPQLMTKARRAMEGSFNREDGLRSFGQLLRQGKIQKIRGGQFVASEDIGFKPQQRRVG